MKKTKKKAVIVLSLMIIILIWVVYTNVSVGFSEYTIYYDTLPEAFDGFKIAQVSDFHNADFGDVREDIVSGIKEYEPDIIVFTGDMIDLRRTNVDISLELVKVLSEIAPCYYVTGNHEAWVSKKSYTKLEEGLLEYGVTILRDSEVVLTREDDKISLIGVDDPDYSLFRYDKEKSMDAHEINSIATDGLFTIMLSHRPEYYENYKESDVNLVFTGHVHGGQFRLPFIGGLYGPDQGIFPMYDSGVYEDDEFAMVVSRGVGNSAFPVRFNNQPEVVLVELKCEK